MVGHLSLAALWVTQDRAVVTAMVACRVLGITCAAERGKVLYAGMRVIFSVCVWPPLSTKHALRTPELLEMALPSSLLTSESDFCLPGPSPRSSPR